MASYLSRCSSATENGSSASGGITSASCGITSASCGITSASCVIASDLKKLRQEDLNSRRRPASHWPTGSHRQATPATASLSATEKHVAITNHQPPAAHRQTAQWNDSSEITRHTLTFLFLDLFGPGASWRGGTAVSQRPSGVSQVPARDTPPHQVTRTRTNGQLQQLDDNWPMAKIIMPLEHDRWDGFLDGSMPTGCGANLV